jgi:hypothetical protein
MTLKQRFPYLFETYALDAGGRPLNDPSAPKDNPNQLKVIGPRVPTLAEVLEASVGNMLPVSLFLQAAADIVEFQGMKASAPTAAASPYSGPQRRLKAGVSPTGVERRVSLSAPVPSPFVPPQAPARPSGPVQPQVPPSPFHSPVPHKP